LRNYGYLQIEPFETKKWGDLEITPLSPGSGLLGLPGDYTSPSRFVRALVLKEISLPTEGGLETVNQFFRIMDSFNVPSSQGEGTSEAETEAEKQEHLPSVTQWTVAHDTTDRVTYYHTAWNRRIRKIDLDKIDFSKGGVRKRPIDKQQVQNVKDITEDLQ
jgi:choloylglycine hydrolase